jgi:prepilin-type N-terminal cleavage/methylation domain-containing protein
VNNKLLTLSSRGFTLIETVIALLLLSVIASMTVTTNGNLFHNQADIRQLQNSTPLLQACAERVLAIRRISGFSMTPDFDAACDALTGTDTFNVIVTSNTGSASCPNNAVCQLVRIYIKNNGSTFGPVALQLMNY